MIQNGRLYLMNNSYKTEQEFLDSYEKKGLFKKKKEIKISSISSFAHPETKPKRLRITSTSGKLWMDFANTQDLAEVADYLQKERRFTPETKGVSTFRAITPSLIGLGLTILFTFIIYEDAVTLEEGSYVDTTAGFRPLNNKLYVWLAKKLGSQNTLFTGAAIALVCLYFMFKAFKHPPNEVVYQ